MPLRTTHTFVVLELSRAAFNEIKQKLEQASYEHAFLDDDGKLLIDMHGIAVANEQRKNRKTTRRR